MNRDRWRELKCLMTELNVVSLLRECTPDARLYLVDRLCLVVDRIDSAEEIETRDSYWLPLGEEDQTEGRGRTQVWRYN